MSVSLFRRRWNGGILLVAMLGLCWVPRTAATVVEPPDFDALVNRSDCVVRARVKSVSAQIVTSGPSRRIFTQVELEVLEVVAGQPASPLVLRFLGGRVGDEEMVVDGSPQLQVGEEGIFFVSGNGRAFCPLYAMGYGLYPVAEEAATKRRYVTRGDLRPMASVAEISRPLTAEGAVPAPVLSAAQALTPEEFVRQIKAARRPASPHAAAN